MLVAAARTTEQSQSNVRSKLYFLGTLISLNDDKAAAALEVREDLPVLYFITDCVCVCVKLQNFWTQQNMMWFC